MGHRHIQSTATYVQTLTDAERVLKLKIADENKQNRKLAKKDKVQNYFVGGIM